MLARVGWATGHLKGDKPQVNNSKQTIKQTLFQLSTNIISIVKVNRFRSHLVKVFNVRLVTSQVLFLRMHQITKHVFSSKSEEA